MNKSEAYDEWNELAQDYKRLEAANAKYLKELREVSKLQQACLKQIDHQRYRLKAIRRGLAEAKRRQVLDEATLEDFNDKLMKREIDLQSIEQTLPKKTGRYLRLVLGDIDVSFLDKESKYRYKDQYEEFKLYNHVLAFAALTVLLYYPSRPLEQLYHAFLLWYYCTITVRESVLKTNGSRIRGWWRYHHVLSTISSAIFLTWPDNETWYELRHRFYWYNVYNCFLQYLQFRYQKGTLYRLKALGQRDNMDITIEGFHSWMWRGLTFLLPMLFIGYLYQLVLAVSYYRLSYHPQATWHVTANAVIFFLFFVGNSATTIMVVPAKMRQKMAFNYQVMKNRLYGAVGERVKIGRG